MRYDNSGRLAFVTGGCGDIGRAVVESLTKSGCAVVALDRVTDADAPSHFFDLRDRAALPGRAAYLTGEFGYPDILVNCAGVSFPCAFDELPDERIAEIVETNLLGLMLFTKLMLKGMVNREVGSIINVASKVASLPMVNNAVYGASKSGVVAFTRQLSMEYGRRGIRVNCISPGLIETRMNAVTRSDKAKLSSILSRQAVHRVGRPADVANLVMFLVSPEADFIAGADLHVDGGFQ